MAEEAALEDLRERIRNYEAVYEVLDDDKQSYIKIINLSAKVRSQKAKKAKGPIVSA